MNQKTDVNSEASLREEKKVGVHNLMPLVQGLDKRDYFERNDQFEKGWQAREAAFQQGVREIDAPPLLPPWGFDVDNRRPLHAPALDSFLEQLPTLPQEAEQELANWQYYFFKHRINYWTRAVQCPVEVESNRAGLFHGALADKYPQEVLANWALQKNLIPVLQDALNMSRWWIEKSIQKGKGIKDGEGAIEAEDGDDLESIASGPSKGEQIHKQLVDQVRAGNIHVIRGLLTRQYSELLAERKLMTERLFQELTNSQTQIELSTLYGHGRPSSFGLPEEHNRVHGELPAFGHRDHQKPEPERYVVDLQLVALRGWLSREKTGSYRDADTRSLIQHGNLFPEHIAEVRRIDEQIDHLEAVLAGLYNHGAFAGKFHSWDILASLPPDTQKICDGVGIARNEKPDKEVFEIHYANHQVEGIQKALPSDAWDSIRARYQPHMERFQQYEAYRLAQGQQFLREAQVVKFLLSNVAWDDLRPHIQESEELRNLVLEYRHHADQHDAAAEYFPNPYSWKWVQADSPDEYLAVKEKEEQRKWELLRSTLLPLYEKFRSEGYFEKKEDNE